MTKDEALKLALEALEALMIERGSIYDKAITAIKEALAQPEQAPMNYYRADAKGNLERIDIHSAQPEQERFLVATIGNWGRVEWADGVFPSLGDKMYSAPRTWVGLTDEEIRLLASWWPSYDQMPALMVLAKDIQNSLKEKNT